MQFTAKIVKKRFVRASFRRHDIQYAASRNYQIFRYRLNLFLSYHVPTKVAAPFSAYKTHTTHNFSIRSDKGLTPET